MLEDVVAPPRVATMTALAETTIAPEQTPLVLSVPTATPGSVVSAESSFDPQNAVTPITFWVNDTTPETIERIRAMTAQFTEQSGIPVETVFIDNQRLSGLIGTADITGTLPDVVLHSIEQTDGWLVDGVLDAAAATAVVEQLGADTFAPGILDQVRDAAGEIAALPSDASQNLLIYRRDWFDAAGLQPPITYDAIYAAAERFNEPEGLTSGIVVATDAKLSSTQRIFEHLAIANGCRLVDAQGEIVSIHPACLETLDYYRDLINQFSPIGFQTDDSALKAYLSGRTAMIMTTPEALPVLAGLDSFVQPRCPECAANPLYLVENSGLITSFSGYETYGTAANYADMTLLGITTAADTEAAQALAAFWFTDGYADWLTLFPERKVPLRLDSAETPNQFLDLWRNAPLRDGSPSLAGLFGDANATLLTSNLETTERWGFKEGQGRVIGEVYPSLEMSQMLQELLSGYISSSQAVYELYNRVVDQIPNYGFELPTPTPDPDAEGNSAEN